MEKTNEEFKNELSNGLYNEYSKFLKEKYGEKVYKLPINIPVTCPNRDGTKGTLGCTFCAEVGTGFESLENTLSVSDQLIKNMEYIGKRYHAKKFIAYFQNYTNTYLPFDKFKKYIEDSVIENIVEIDISTRPDCIDEKYLKFLSDFRDETGVEITFELGLQTVNYHTLDKINRGHGVAEFIDAVQKLKKYNFLICAHVILNLPWDDMRDVVETAKIISVLGVDQVKIHSLYLMEGTVMGQQYKNGEFEICSKSEYEDRVIAFLRHSNNNIVFQRLVGRAPKENSIFVNWNSSWWKIREEIKTKMIKDNVFQGDLVN